MNVNLNGLVKLSVPTKQQVVNSVERVVAVFVVAFLGYLKVTSNPLSKASLHAAALAGAAAVYQAVKSVATSL